MWLSFKSSGSVPPANQSALSRASSTAKITPFSRVVKYQNASKNRVTKMSPQMSNLTIDGSIKPQIFAEKQIF